MTGNTCTLSAKLTWKQLFTYAYTHPVQVYGKFTCETREGQGIARAEFIVMKGKGIPLLGRPTAMKLGMLKIGVDIAMVTETSQLLKQQYTEVFSGAGKINIKQISAGPLEHKHEAEQYIRLVAISVTPRTMNTREVEEASATDDELHNVRRPNKTGCFDECKPYAPIAGELCVIGQLVLRGTRISEGVNCKPL